LAELSAVFVTISPLLSDIITEVMSQQVNLNIIAQFDERDPIFNRLPALATDLVVIGLRAGETDEIAAIVLKVVPAAKVIAISSDGRNAYLHEMRPHRGLMVDFSPNELIAALLGRGSGSSSG
jgi:DNA-binding NarL/FixJ family response regulator